MHAYKNITITKQCHAAVLWYKSRNNKSFTCLKRWRRVGDDPVSNKGLISLTPVAACCKKESYK